MPFQCSGIANVRMHPIDPTRRGQREAKHDVASHIA